MEEERFSTCAYQACNNIFKYRSNKKYCCRKCKTNQKAVRPGGFKERRKAIRAILHKPYSIFKKDFCEYCNFVAIHSCQLDIDHIDGNKENNDPMNLQTLCANCHRLKTRLNKDWEDRS